jgi:uncharacterized protein (TIGR02145 family)
MKKIVLLILLVNFYSVGQVQAQLFGGHLKSKSQFPPGHVNCNPKFQTAVVEVVSPGTGRIWMDRNLGAEQVATSSTDKKAFGDLYQWGRGADGHQCRYSTEQTGRSFGDDTPGHRNFITVSRSTTFPENDWRDPQNNNLWQGVTGINNPCPEGFRIPTAEEFRQERIRLSIDSSADAFNSVLKFVVSGYRDINGDTLSTAQGSKYGLIWTSTDSGTTPSSDDAYRQYKSQAFAYSDTGDKPASAFENAYDRARGYSVRCIKHQF